MSRHDLTINLLPTQFDRGAVRGPGPSLAVTAIVVVAILVAAMTRGSAPSADAAPPAGGRDDATPTKSAAGLDRRPQRLFRIAGGDRSRLAFERAQNWVPWHRVLANLADCVSDQLHVDAVSYFGSEHLLQIDGGCRRVTAVSDLVVDLDRWTFLVDPDPYRVENDAERDLMNFGLRFRVRPRIDAEPVQ